MKFPALFQRKTSKKAAAGAADTGKDDADADAIPASRSKSELEQVFSKFDVNGDGKISSAELGSIMASLGHHASDEELTNMITDFDADGDGFIDLQEFIALNTQGVDTDEVMNNLKDAFSVYDIDGNGSITAEELHKVLASIGEPASMVDCRQMISAVDSNGDGVISFDEFKVMMMMGARWDSSPTDTIDA